MPGMSKEVQAFIAECDRLLDHTRKNGGLSEEDCDALKYYVYELSSHVMKFCGTADEVSKK